MLHQNAGYELIYKGNLINQQIWREEVLFSPEWWITCAFTFVPWLVWYACYDRDPSMQYSLAAILLIAIAAALDTIGVSFDRWRYYGQVIPILGGMIPWNISVLPVCFLITLRFFKHWKPIFKGLLLGAGIAFIGEPSMDAIGLTVHHRWEHSYSFLIYFLLFLLIHYVATREGKGLIEEKGTDEGCIDRCEAFLRHSSDGIFILERKYNDSRFYFVEANERFCQETGYSWEELEKTPPKLLTDRSMCSAEIKYRPLLTKGEMTLNTVVVTKCGQKRFVKVFCKRFALKHKVQVLYMVQFLEGEVVTDKIN